jgi:hypothetical protein
MSVIRYITADKDRGIPKIARFASPDLAIDAAHDGK